MLVGTQRWLCVVLTLLPTVCGLYLPSTSYRYHRRPAYVERHSSKRLSQPACLFYQMMRPQLARYKDRAFVDIMFQIFDLDSNDAIEKNEFRSILQLLGWVNNTL